MSCPFFEKRSRSERLGFGIRPNVYELRDGADDEGARSAVAGHGEEDHLVASSRDYRSERPHNAALAGATGAERLRRTGGSAQRGSEPEAGTAGDMREGTGLVPGTLLRPQHTAFPREAEGGARDRVELHVGAEGAAGSGLGSQTKQARQAS